MRTSSIGRYLHDTFSCKNKEFPHHFGLPFTSKWWKHTWKWRLDMFTQQWLAKKLSTIPLDVWVCVCVCNVTEKKHPFTNLLVKISSLKYCSIIHFITLCQQRCLLDLLSYTESAIPMFLFAQLFTQGFQGLFHYGKETEIKLVVCVCTHEFAALPWQK